MGSDHSPALQAQDFHQDLSLILKACIIESSLLNFPRPQWESVGERMDEQISPSFQPPLATGGAKSKVTQTLSCAIS